MAARCSRLAHAAFGVLLILALPEGSYAHRAGISYSDVRVRREGAGTLLVDYSLKLCSHALAPIDRDRDERISSAELALKRDLVEKVLKSNLRLSRDGIACKLDLVDFAPQESGAWVVFEFLASCPGAGPLEIQYLLLATDAQSGYNLARITTEEGYREHLFTREVTDLVIDAGRSEHGGALRPGWAGIVWVAAVALASFDPFALLWIVLLFFAGGGRVALSFLGI